MEVVEEDNLLNKLKEMLVKVRENTQKTKLKSFNGRKSPKGIVKLHRKDPDPSHYQGIISGRSTNSLRKSPR